MKRTYLRTIHVRPLPGCPRRGRLTAGPVTFACALGRSGMTHTKHEGDGATPVGRFRALGAYWRADRLARPRMGVKLSPLKPDQGWCEVPSDRNYNRPVRLPYPKCTDHMHRADHLYDIVLDLAWNRGPIRKGAGSAIFLHLARSGYSPTQGCIGLSLADLRKLLSWIGKHTVFDVHR